MAKTLARRPKKKTAAEKMMDLDDTEEVELDSLGNLFVHLIDNDCSQDEPETSQADAPEVIYISSDSDISSDLECSPPMIIRRAV